MQKNDICEGLVAGLGTDGEGIINVDGVTVFVPFCLEGERFAFKILKVNGGVAYGKIEKITVPSENRVAPPCPVFYKCGGCDIQHMNYASQLAFKRESVKRALLKIGGIGVEAEQTVPCDRQYGYRNKLVLPIGVDGEGRTIAGFYARRSHRIVPSDNCLIQAEWAKKVYSAVLDFAAATGVSGYDEQKGKGVLRRIAVREVAGKFVFALVVTRNIDVSYLIAELEKHFKDFTFLLNVNTDKTNGIFGKEWHICRGDGFIEAESNGILYSAGANTFLQVNDEVRDKLYARVLSEVDADCTAVDLYSGGGMLTAMLAKKCSKAYGIEIVAEASECADELKERNGLRGKMVNICGAAENEIDGVLKTVKGKSVIVCDPPRKGMERSVVRAIAASGADKVILVSCNPATLARDLGLLTGTLVEDGGKLVKTNAPSGGYRIISVTPFDMFPQTKWCETLVVLSKKIPDSHINIDVEFGEDEGQFSLKKIKERAESRKPKEKITYKKIQDYIEKIYGFKVHTAYIAEVKRDLGLPMYDAPNAVEELKHPRAHPTPKMVDAIKETLKHFEII